MITIDEAVAKAAEQIDQVLQHRWDTLEQQMIADGVDPNGVADAPCDADGPWSRVSFDWILQRQKALDRQWRAETLAQLRTDLEHWLAETPPP